MADYSMVFTHLARDYGEPIKDPVWKNITLSPGLLRVAAHKAFQKLNGIKQLGPTYLVYPGATHTRLNHSLGVFHLARRMLLQLVGGAAAGDAAAPAAHLRLSDLTVEGAKAFLCAALLHDLGHYPYAHSLKDVGLRSHESLTAERILQADLSRLIREDVGTDPGLVAAIVDPSLDHSARSELIFFRNLLSGVLDPDKLDYLNRDAYFCGVPHGTQDVDFVLAEIRPRADGLAVTEKGLSAVESILFSKYLMYKTVYWHKTVRIATGMIKKAVLLAMAEQRLRPQDLYWLDDNEFAALTEKHAYDPFELIRNVSERRLFKLVAAVPFDPENPLHRLLQDVHRRLDFEQQLCREVEKALGRRLAPQSLIIDVPEPINFEVDLPVLQAGTGEVTAYDRSRSVFNGGSVRSFVRSLRSISLFAEPAEDLGAVLIRMDAGKILTTGIG
ncbi:MAG: HD domain-containing protein [Spirochaetales bacterium]|nr:HD domain-containing protein [Spirochaetales bacterium]